jgi:radical SAM superfamily enzyme YgiQ (UPF0313 family)
LFLASSLEKYTDHEVTILDMEQKKYKNHTFKEVFQDNHSDIFGITATTYTRFEAIKIAKYLKKIRPRSFIVVGGVHFMYCARDTLERIPEIDIVVRGEGELTIVALINALDQRKPLDQIKGITYRLNDEIVDNEEQDLFEDLDSIPVYSKFTWDEYPEYLFGFPENMRATSIMSSRGCPHKCIFCTKAGMKYRVRNSKNIVDEIELLQDRFELEGFNFLDLTFTASRNHVKSVCQEIIDRNLKIKWWCESRANIPLELLGLMKKAGCVSLVVGVESGSPRILSEISKGITVDQVTAFCKKCSEVGIRVTPYFMFSHRNETFQDARMTLDLISKLEKYTAPCSFQPTAIFPGSELEKIAFRQGILPEGFSWNDPYESELNKELGQLANVPLYIDQLTTDELKYLMEQKKCKTYANMAAQMKIRDLFAKILNSIKNQKASSKYLFSPRIYYEYLLTKFKR